MYTLSQFFMFSFSAILVELKIIFSIRNYLNINNPFFLVLYQITSIERFSFVENHCRSSILKIISLLLILILYPSTSLALTSNVSETKIISIQNKVSKNVSKKFCNSIGFGLSKESAIKFAVIESNKELSSNKFFSEIDKDQTMEDIAINIVEKCGYSIDFVGQKGVDEFQSYLREMDIMT